MNNNSNKTLNYFISYATEDREIANFISNLLKKSLGVKKANEPFIKIFKDYDSLRIGYDEGYKKEIQERLRNTDRLIIIYTGQQKSSHGYTGWEVGYYDNEVEHHKTRKTESKKVVFHTTDKPPKVLEEIQALNIGISKEQLKESPENFKNRIQENLYENPIRSFLQDERIVLQEDIFNKLTTTDINECTFDTILDEIITNLYVEIHEHLRKKTFVVYPAQKQFIIKAKKQDIEKNNNTLPDNAIIVVPEGDISSALTIFGNINCISGDGIRWGSFKRDIMPSINAAFWMAAINNTIASVISSSNSIVDDQRVVSADGENIYRIILSRYITYFDDTYEFHIYFVKLYRSLQYGDDKTTKLLAAIQILSRFRFLFLEEASEFNPRVISANLLNITDIQFADIKNNRYQIFEELIRELDLFIMLSKDAKLEKLTDWISIVDNASLLVEMLEKWRILESSLRSSINTLLVSRLNNNDIDVTTYIEKILLDLKQMINTINPYNALFLIKATKKLNNIVDNDFQKLLKEDPISYERFISKDND
jgi:hypothetical protein